MSKLKNMRVIRIPPFRAVSSGEKTLDAIFGEGGFEAWCAAHRHLIRDLLYSPANFLWHVGDPSTYGHGLNVLIYALKEDVTQEDTAPYEIIDFPGGMFLVATGDEKDDADLNETVRCMMDWIRESPVFEYGDFPRSGMCNMPGGNGEIDQALGIAQQQIFLPLKYKSK